MNKLFASVLLCAALLGSGILRADNIVISNRKSSILITAPKGESPRIQYFGPRLANPATYSTAERLQRPGIPPVRRPVLA